jgi:hypothetical protein
MTSIFDTPTGCGHQVSKITAPGGGTQHAPFAGMQSSSRASILLIAVILCGAVPAEAAGGGGLGEWIKQRALGLRVAARPLLRRANLNIRAMGFPKEVEQELLHELRASSGFPAATPKRQPLTISLSDSPTTNKMRIHASPDDMSVEILGGPRGWKDVQRLSRGIALITQGRTEHEVVVVQQGSQTRRINVTAGTWGVDVKNVRAELDRGATIEEALRRTGAAILND